MNITVDRKVIKQALAVLENPMYGDFYEWTLALKDARDALRTALGQQYMTNAAGELEPVTVVQTGVGIETPKRKPLTEEEIKTYRHMIDWTASWSYINFARAIEAAHNIKD